MTDRTARPMGWWRIGIWLVGLGLTSCQVQVDSGEDAAAVSEAAADTTASDSTRSRGSGGLFGFLRRGGDEEDTEEELPVPVELAPVVRAPMSEYFSTTAVVEAEKEATLLAKVRGQVVDVRAEEGDRVERGQLLARLDDAESAAQLGHARVRAVNMQRERERAESMFDKGLIPERDLAEARYNHELSAADLNVAKLQVTHARVRAPFAGVVTARHIDPGENAEGGTPLFDLADLEPLLVHVFMPERQVTRMEVGQAARVLPAALDDVALDGRVIRVSPRVDPRTGTVRATIELGETHPEVRPGSFVRVKIQTNRREGALVIPKRALVQEGGDTHVFCAEADTVRRVPVVLGYQDDTQVEVLEGLGEGDQVVRVGQGALRQGSRFVAIEPAAPEAADAP